MAPERPPFYGQVTPCTPRAAPPPLTPANGSGIAAALQMYTHSLKLLLEWNEKLSLTLQGFGKDAGTKIVCNEL